MPTLTKSVDKKYTSTLVGGADARVTFESDFSFRLLQNPSSSPTKVADKSRVPLHFRIQQLLPPSLPGRNGDLSATYIPGSTASPFELSRKVKNNGDADSSLPSDVSGGTSLPRIVSISGTVFWRDPSPSSPGDPDPMSVSRSQLNLGGGESCGDRDAGFDGCTRSSKLHSISRRLGVRGGNG
ncbi:hypothetical protein PQX77_021130 [Marasmius sp. AFHP31]|nr:hypothetical protein PQX77_021130 [Marasmius sp. AFHP31]